MIEIDGSQGEGGGQLLRTSVSLSCITGKPFRITRIRQNRSKPGLMRQHLVAVQSAARVAAARVEGDALGSRELTFVPGPVSPGDYRFDIGTAGSTPLVLQTLIPPLVRAGAPSRLTLIGGTHVPFSPCWHYLAEVFAPALLRLGARVELTLDSCGFYPKGGGRVRCRIHPCSAFSRLDARQRGPLLRVGGLSAVANLPLSIAQRQAHSALQLMAAPLAGVPVEVAAGEVRAIGQGTFIFLKAGYDNWTAGFTSLGARGKPAEVAGAEAAEELVRHHLSGMPVDPHLADQLVLYLAQAAGPSVFSTSRVTGHLETNLQITARFLDISFEISGHRDAPGEVRITPARHP